MAHAKNMRSREAGFLNVGSSLISSFAGPASKGSAKSRKPNRLGPSPGGEFQPQAIHLLHLDVSKNRGGPPKWMVKIMENPIKMDDLGVPLFSEASI